MISKMMSSNILDESTRIVEKRACTWRLSVCQSEVRTQETRRVNEREVQEAQRAAHSTYEHKPGSLQTGVGRCRAIRPRKKVQMTR